MFTGIVEELGEVVCVTEQEAATRLSVRGARMSDIELGESIAVNGVCLTAAEASARGFTADVMRETLLRSTLGSLTAGDPVNLERAVTPTTRLGGHLVQGHVDDIGDIAYRQPAEHWEVVGIRLPERLLAYVVEKGSITVDGVSLTVAEVDGQVVTVSLIPETLRRTTLGRRQVGDRVNIEVDVLAKYVERLLSRDHDVSLVGEAAGPGVSPDQRHDRAGQRHDRGTGRGGAAPGTARAPGAGQ